MSFAISLEESKILFMFDQGFSHSRKSEKSQAFLYVFKMIEFGVFRLEKLPCCLEN